MSVEYKYGCSPKFGQIVEPLVPHPLTVVDLLLFFDYPSDLVFRLLVCHHDKRPRLCVCSTRGRTCPEEGEVEGRVLVKKEL